MLGIALIAIVVAGTSYYLLTTQYLPLRGYGGKTTSISTVSSTSTHTTTRTQETASSSTTSHTVKHSKTSSNIYKVIGVTDLSTPEKLFSTIKYLRISLLITESPNKSMKVTIAYGVGNGGIIEGKNTYKVSIAISAKNTTQEAAVWITKDFKTPLKVSLPNGKVLTGKEALMYGSMLLNQIGQYLLTKGEFGHLKVFIYKNGSMRTSLKGWKVEKVSEKSMNINGKLYSGYDILLKNVNKTSNSASEIEVGLAKISSNLWYFSFVKLNIGEGKSALFKVESIELSGQH